MKSGIFNGTSRIDPQTIGINMREWIEVKCKHNTLTYDTQVL